MKTLNLILSFTLLAGCGDAAVHLADLQADGRGSTKQTEAWSSQDNPALFTGDLVYTLADLPLSGEAQNIPWAGSYWPVYEDSINYKWDGPQSESAPKKYERAFGVTGVEDKVSRAHGIDSHSTATECTESSVCDSSKGETCAKREGQEKGRCIPTWWGICHAWAPAAILLPEPKHPVTRNGVTFKVQDLKALASLVHNSSSSKFISLRCNKTGAEELAVDAYGRVVANECRDTNAGTYHVLLANYLGLRKQAFAEDRVYDFEVWNQPLRGFRVVEKKDITLAEANRLLGVTAVGGTTTTKSGTVAKGAWEHQDALAVTAGQAVKVVMSGSADADLYVKFGAQPTAQAHDCRPYAGGSDETCELTVPEGQTQLFVSVNGYADSSTYALSTTVGGSAPTTWQFNKQAVAFAYVKSEVQYIAESSSSTDGNLAARIDQYTKTDRYEYILELDAAGRIVGGEWVGASQKAHPDFLWLPTGVRTTTVAGGAISYATVKALVMESVQDEGGGTSTEQTVQQSGTLAKDVWAHFGPFPTATGAKLKAVMTGSGDADLYVRKGLTPTAVAYDCRPYKNGSAESCEVDGGGPVYVSVHGYAASSNFEVTVVFLGEGGTPPPPGPTFTHLNVTQDVAQGELKVFTLAVPAGKNVVVRTAAANDVDLYLKAGAAPTTTAYDLRAWTSSGNETLTFTATAAVTLHIGVHGYAASGFTLTTSDE